MQAFSIEKALGAGFRLIAREPLAVLMWGVAYAVMTIVIQAIAMGPAVGALIQGALSDPEAAAAAFGGAAQTGSLMTFPLIMLLSLGAYAVIYGAIARADLHPDDRRFFFLRVSKRELWIAVSYLALSILFIVGCVILAVPVGVAVSVLSDGSKGSMILWGLLLGIPAFVAILYFSARFSMTWIMAFEEERFILFESWKLTKGHGWRLLLLTLALVFLIVIATLGVVLAVVVLGGILAVVIKAMGAIGGVLAVIAVLAAILLYVALFGAMYAVMLAPYIEAYRGIRDAQTTEPAAA